MRAIARGLHIAPKVRGLIYIIGLLTMLTLATSATSICGECALVIVLKAIDYGEIRHVEYVPRPLYEAKTLTCSEVAKELLLKAIYGVELDDAKLSFILACRRDGYFSRTPSEAGFDAEAT